jgi:hypothetical protein
MLYLAIFNGDFDVNLSMFFSMVRNTTFNNGLVISWLSVSLVEETGVSEKTPDLYHILSFTIPC